MGVFFYGVFKGFGVAFRDKPLYLGTPNYLVPSFSFLYTFLEEHSMSTSKNRQRTVVDFLSNSNNFAPENHAAAQHSIGQPSHLASMTFETNQSLVFLHGRHAYKLFKAIDRYRDNTTLEGRLENAQLELEANQSLAGDLYIGIMAVVQNPKGNLELLPYHDDFAPAEEHLVVDYVVKMRRFNTANMMYNRLFSDTLTSLDLFELGQKVARFHKSQPTVETDMDAFTEAFCDHFQKRIIDYVHRLNCRHGMDLLIGLGSPVHRMIKDLKPLFLQRGAFFNRVHGDMDFGNIATFNDKLVPFDAQVLFENERENDSALDVGFLVAPLVMQGRADLVESLITGYTSILPCNTLRQVLPIWAAYGAFIRGSSWLNRAQNMDDPREKARLETYGYRFLIVAHRLVKGQISFEPDTTLPKF